MRILTLSLMAIACAPAFAQTPYNERPCEPGIVVDEQRATAAPMPLLVLESSSEYPSAMRRRGVEASCTVMFDLDQDGKPTGVEARCNSGPAKYPLSGAVDYASMAQSFAKRAIVCSRYEPASAPAAQQGWRTNVMFSLFLTLDDGSGPPDLPRYFGRDGIEEQITPEQAAYYSTKIDEANAELAEYRVRAAAEIAANEAAKNQRPIKKNN